MKDKAIPIILNKAWRTGKCAEIILNFTAHERKVYRRNPELQRNFNHNLKWMQARNNANVAANTFRKN